MIITLIILLPLAFLFGALVTLKAVQLGLKWNYQINIQHKPPDSPLPSNPLTTIVEKVEERKAEKEQKQVVNTLHEWLYGPDKKDGDDG